VVLVVGSGRARRASCSNFGASTVVLLGSGGRCATGCFRGTAQAPSGLEPCSVRAPYGAREASVYALSIIDRYYIYHSRSASLAASIRSR